MDQSEALVYWKKEGLDQYFPTPHDGDEDTEKAIPMDIPDLVRIHHLIRTRKCFTVLEFGVGYSTVIIADALQKNKNDWEALASPPVIRNRFIFQCFSVDSSESWLEIAKARIPDPLSPFIQFSYSRVEIGTHNGQLCHFYKNLPDIVPDFIYLDGPDPQTVEGEVNGMSFKCPERTVMSADLLLMEPTMLPGTFILVDGRTNNARFLQNNFRRNFRVHWDRDGDVTTFELMEARLGKYNLLGMDFFNN